MSNPNPDLEIFIYELPELLNNVIASAADEILEFIKYFLNRDLGQIFSGLKSFMLSKKASSLVT